MYGVLHVDNIAHTVSLVPLKKLDNIPVFVEPLDPHKLCGVRVFDSSSFRMVLCFFDCFYVTVDDMHVSLYDAVLFSPVADGQETNPWRTLSRSDDVGTVWLCDFSPMDEGVNPGPGSRLTRISCRLRMEVDGSLTLKPVQSTAICDAWDENNCSTSLRRLTSVHKRTRP